MKSTPIFPRPVEGDSPDYYFRYINLVPDVDILTYLHTQRDWFGDWIESLTDEQATYRYAPGKWSLAEMIGHVLDSERIFSYRMLAISRGEENKLPSFDQDAYVANSIFDSISPVDLANDWRAARSSTVYLSRSMNAEMASRMGIANALPIKASSFPYILAGHVLHHYSVAKERYLGTS
jgi:DinB superfamily